MVGRQRGIYFDRGSERTSPHLDSLTLLLGTSLTHFTFVAHHSTHKSAQVQPSNSPIIRKFRNFLNLVKPMNFYKDSNYQYLSFGLLSIVAWKQALSYLSL